MGEHEMVSVENRNDGGPANRRDCADSQLYEKR